MVRGGLIATRDCPVAWSDIGVQNRQVGVFVGEILYEQSIFGFAIFHAASKIRNMVGGSDERNCRAPVVGFVIALLVLQLFPTYL